jgi:uncharacterized membrane protein YsdA (DUF1294 family)
MTFAFAFLAFVAAAVAVGELPFVVLLAYIAASCLAYLAYFFDKAAAVKGRWRTPESSLHFFGLLGGWPGAMLAQKTYRHKTRKHSFRATFWVTVAVNCTALGWLLSSPGKRVLRTLLGGS